MLTIYSEMTEDVFNEIMKRNAPIKSVQTNLQGNVNVEINSKAWEMLCAIGKNMQKGEILEDGGLVFGLSDGKKIFDARAYGQTDDFSKIGPTKEVDFIVEEDDSSMDYAGLFGETQAFDSMENKKLSELKEELNELDEAYAQLRGIREHMQAVLKKYRSLQKEQVSYDAEAKEIKRQLEGKVFGKSELKAKIEGAERSAFLIGADAHTYMQEYLALCDDERYMQSVLKQLTNGNDYVAVREGLTKAIGKLERIKEDDLER